MPRSGLVSRHPECANFPPAMGTPPYNTVLYKKHPLQNQTSDFQGKKKRKKMKKTAKSVQVSSPICYCYHLAALSHHQYCYLQAYTTFKETVLTWSTLYLNPIHSKHHMETWKSGSTRSGDRNGFGLVQIVTRKGRDHHEWMDWWDGSRQWRWDDGLDLGQCP